MSVLSEEKSWTFRTLRIQKRKRKNTQKDRQAEIWPWPTAIFLDYLKTMARHSKLNLILCSLIFIIFCIYRPVVILEIGVAVLVAVFLLVYLATRYDPPKDPLFYGMSSDTDLIG